VTTARLDERLDLRAIEIRAHDSHTFAVAPIEIAVLLIEMDLFCRERAAFGNDDRAIFSVDVGPLDRTIVQVGNTHVGPVNVPRLNIDDNAIGKSALRYDGLSVGTVGIHRMNTAAA